MDADVEIADNRRRRFREIKLEYFWETLQKPVGCWLYDGAKEINGYGYLKNPLAEKPKFITAHKLAWILKNGPIPEGKLVLHRCDIRACCNPDHLFLGTDAENIHDKIRKGRARAAGTQNYWAKLNDEKVHELDRLRYEGWTFDRIAKHLGIGSSTAVNIYTRKTWKHVPRLSPLVPYRQRRRGIT